MPTIETYEAGFNSGFNGEDPRVCPFETMTEEWRWWNEGQRRGAVFYRLVADRPKTCPYYAGCQPDHCTECWKHDAP